MNKLQVYASFREEVKNCSNCDLGGCGLVDGQDPHVVGQGNTEADLMFIAEAPGKQETIHGRPLTPPGTSGNVYENILKFLDLTRDDVYTTNVVLCRPPKNRDPELYEIKKCQPYLERQIKLVEPKLVVTFGRFAAQSFINNFKITKDHGNIIRSEKYNVDIFPIYHPAYYKAYASAKRREEFKMDINKLRKMVNKNFRKVA
jgi:DNA polymerase